MDYAIHMLEPSRAAGLRGDAVRSADSSRSKLEVFGHDSPIEASADS